MNHSMVRALVAVILFGWTSSLCAEELKTESWPTTLEPSVLASSLKLVERDYAVDTSNTVVSEEGFKFPIQAKVSRTDKDECTVVINNRTNTATYRIDYSIDGLNSRKEKLFAHLFTDTIRPGRYVERTVECLSAESVQVVLQAGEKLKQ